MSIHFFYHVIHFKTSQWNVLVIQGIAKIYLHKKFDELRS